ncbi:2,3-dihydro-2,3-dihydroxybenzoate dehydrogenase [Terrihabitans rhizophilus]|uniref:2,3-dihydro-2,3-dihydroxybenzoate dehydrogenase n=1 Tax=Terrihabitans rhizophilus TaxID=3092662 RepID=A0ABU4RN63_9HYPH|nr:2,3-dihydro-2,3-dihydroxybenzoate dehydrogenase [Terrihabitans sp. PJ23]MDX6805095.1 2,3-dihydro-2,3-dihydroxybenzoate dehydrogenase [Terrihabitans sp. PJ23]
MSGSGLAGKIALVTGAAGGIGQAVVRSLHAEGVLVAAFDVDGDAVEALAAGLPLGTVVGRALDVSDSGAVEAAVARVESGLGPIDLLVNGAGVLSTTRVVDTDDAEWARVFSVNTLGVFNVSRAVTRVMMERRRGSVVTISSNAAGIPRHGMAAYAASKAAATMFTRCLGLELAEYGIRCNVVAPGSTRTSMQTGMWSDPSGEARVIEGSLATFKAGIPLGKIAEPEDVAEAVLFLLSDRAGHITMTDLYVDGGATQRG